MPTPDQSRMPNRPLALMPADDFALLAPDLEFVQLPKGFIIAEPDQPIEGVFFLTAGVGSIVAISAEGQEVEAGLFGREGFGPTPIAMGCDRAPNRIVIQIQDDAWRLSSEALVAAMARSAGLRDLLLRYIHTLAVQTACTALSNAVHSIDERLARWILMCDDRIGLGEIALTHEYISTMLAVRRPSVTTALHVLEGNGFIRAERGAITLRNRKALEAFAADAYGRPEAEYARLIGPLH